MVEYKYRIAHTTEMTENLNVLFEPSSYDHIFNMGKNVGEGSIERHQLNNGLSIQISRFKFYSKTKIDRQGSTDDNLFILDFIIKGSGELYLKNAISGFKRVNKFNFGAYFGHSKVESYGIFQPGVYNEQIHLVIDKDWVLQEFTNQLKEVFEDSNIKGLFFIFEKITASILKIIRELIESQPDTPFRKSYLKGKALELLTIFFRELKKRSQYNYISPINSAELERLFDLEAYIKNNLKYNLSVSFLASKIGFSESKLQKLFKIVYGKSVHKKINEIKMNAALELLKEGALSISQIGFEMGYQNMSHFSTAFKKVHGFLPSEY